MKSKTEHTNTANRIYCVNEKCYFVQCISVVFYNICVFRMQCKVSVFRVEKHADFSFSFLFTSFKREFAHEAPIIKTKAMIILFAGISTGINAEKIILDKIKCLRLLKRSAQFEFIDEDSTFIGGLFICARSAIFADKVNAYFWLHFR